MKDLKLSFKYSNETAVSTIISQVHLSVVLTPSGTESAKTCQIISHLQITSSSILHFTTISSMMTFQLLYRQSLYHRSFIFLGIPMAVIALQVDWVGNLMQPVSSWNTYALHPHVLVRMSSARPWPLLSFSSRPPWFNLLMTQCFLSRRFLYSWDRNT